MPVFNGVKFPYTEEKKSGSQPEELRLTTAQIQALHKRLTDSGLTIRKDFGGSVKKAWAWHNKAK